MLDPEMRNILDKSRNLEELLNFDYIIRDRIFTGDEVLEILIIYHESDEIFNDRYDKLENEKGAIEEELSELKDKHKKLRDNVKKLAIKYNKLREKKTIKYKQIERKEEVIKYDKRIEAIKNELKGYKGEFVNKLQRILES